MILRAPFPWFGGKSRVAHVVWEAFGNVPNYVEPFAGSLAVLLARPHAPKIETVNDADCYLSNFWRALANAPGDVARWADWPVNEADLHARHVWLLQQTAFRERMVTDPEFFDAKIAGWWVWGLCSWIGGNWCDVAQPISKRLPHLGNAGRGIHRISQQHNAKDGVGIVDYFDSLSQRLRRVRVACGDWMRVLGDSVTWHHGVTGVFLDPPYADGDVSYSAGGRGIGADVAQWARENGDRPQLRIALCGYEGEHDMPPSWRVIAWKAHGGYASQSDEPNENSKRERIWLSPHCLVNVRQRSLFDDL